MLSDKQNSCKSPSLISKASSKERFLRPFIKPYENKENIQVSNMITPAPINRKQAVFSDNPRKFSLNPQEYNDLLSPGHPPQSSNKIPSFKSPQRKTLSYFNIKGSPQISPPLPFKSTQTNQNTQKINKKPIFKTNLPIELPKENLFDKMKTISNEFVQSTKSFINNKINRLSAREKCACSIGLNRQETCEKAYKWLFKRYSKKDLIYLKNVYANLQKAPIIEESIKNQIGRDILRTYPNCLLFKEGHEGVLLLERVLTTFASYDPQIGYVQGMNYIAAFFLYHAEEYIAFWLFALMFEMFELRDIYLPSRIFLVFLKKTIKIDKKFRSAWTVKTSTNH